MLISENSVFGQRWIHPGRAGAAPHWVQLSVVNLPATSPPHIFSYFLSYFGLRASDFFHIYTDCSSEISIYTYWGWHLADMLSAIFSAMMVTLAHPSSAMKCSSRDLQLILGDFSDTCSAHFSDVFAVSSELVDGLHLMNSTLVRAIKLHESLQARRRQLWFVSKCPFSLQLPSNCTPSAIPSPSPPPASPTGFHIAYTIENLALAVTFLVCFLALFVLVGFAAWSSATHRALSSQARFKYVNNYSNTLVFHYII